MEQKNLAKLQTADIEKIKMEKLKDITKLIIGLDEPPLHRLIRFMYTMDNPYIFRVGKTPVKVVFSNRHNVASLQKCVENIVSRHTQ